MTLKIAKMQSKSSVYKMTAGYCVTRLSIYIKPANQMFFSKMRISNMKSLNQ